MSFSHLFSMTHHGESDIFAYRNMLQQLVSTHMPGSIVPLPQSHSLCPARCTGAELFLGFTISRLQTCAVKHNGIPPPCASLHRPTPRTDPKPSQPRGTSDCPTLGTRPFGQVWSVMWTSAALKISFLRCGCGIEQMQGKGTKICMKQKGTGKQDNGRRIAYFTHSTAEYLCSANGSSRFSNTNRSHCLTAYQSEQLDYFQAHF